MHPADTMIDLPLARYRLEFAVETPLHLPAYAGSTLRGAFGGALRASCCLTRQPACEGCPLLATCPYAVVFETRPPAGGHALQKFSHVPHPYVIEPPQWGERDYAPGETLAFHLVLAGRALDQLALIIWAFVKAFRRGVGRGDGTARLLRVTHCGESENTILAGPDGQIAEHDHAVPPAPTFAESITLHFDTPLRLQTDGRRATAAEHTPRRLLMALVRRIALIREFHGAGPLELDFHALGAAAEQLTSEKDLVWRDWTRYSSRQRQKIALGGVVGAWRIRGDLAPFLPFLHLGQWLHVGKEATFGLGGYRILVA
jgi:hypothetical protein